MWFYNVCMLRWQAVLISLSAFFVTVKITRWSHSHCTTSSMLEHINRKRITVLITRKHGKLHLKEARRMCWVSRDMCRTQSTENKANKTLKVTKITTKANPTKDLICQLCLRSTMRTSNQTEPGNWVKIYSWSKAVDSQIYPPDEPKLRLAWSVTR